MEPSSLGKEPQPPAIEPQVSPAWPPGMLPPPSPQAPTKTLFLAPLGLRKLRVPGPHGLRCPICSGGSGREGYTDPLVLSQGPCHALKTLGKGVRDLGLSLGFRVVWACNGDSYGC